MTSDHARQDTRDLAPGTRVLNARDGQNGTVLGAYAGTPGAWTEYEVVVGQAIEVWDAASIVPLDDAERDAGRR